MKVINHHLDMDDLFMNIAGVPKGETASIATNDSLVLESLIECGRREIRTVGDHAYSLKNLNDKSRAIEASHRIIAAPYVGQTDEVLEIFYCLGTEISRF